MIQFSCPKCSKTYTVGDERAGHKVRCGACKEAMTIPLPELVAEPEIPRPTARSYSRGPLAPILFCLGLFLFCFAIAWGIRPGSPGSRDVDKMRHENNVGALKANLDRLTTSGR